MTDEYQDLPPDDVSTDEMAETGPDDGPDAFREDLSGEMSEELSGELAAPAEHEPGDSMVQAARRAVWAPRTRVAVASLAFIAMMFLFVFPTRSYLSQRREVGRAQDAVAVLNAQNKVLARQARLLRTPAEIERLARQQFNLVMPGEAAYNVVADPTASSSPTTTTVP